ncbi:MAG: hypothetical protein ACYDBQ_05245 [Thermoplasmatota archaeon]
MPPGAPATEMPRLPGPLPDLPDAIPSSGIKMPLHCLECGAQFASKEGLARHERTEHHRSAS